MATKPLKSIKFPGLPDTYTIPQIDDTLSNEGEAADAKVVGYAVGPIFSPYTITWNSGGYVNDYGTITPNANNYYSDFTLVAVNGFVPAIIKVTKPTLNDWVNYCFYDANDVRLYASHVENTLSEELSVPAGTVKFRVSASNSTYQSVVVELKNEQLFKGLEKVEERTKDLDGNYSLTWNPNGYVNLSGTITTNANNHYTDFIPVTIQGIIPETIKVTKPTLNDWVNYCFYDKNGTKLYASSVENTLSEELTVPEGSVTFRISASNSTYSNVTVEGYLTEKLVIIAAASEIKSNKAVTIEIEDDNISFSSQLEGHVMTLTAEKSNSRADANPTFNFLAYLMDGATFKNASDDITPIQINQTGMSPTYIGAGHGFSNGLKLTTSNEKQDVDIGSVWSDAGGNQFVLYNVGAGYVKVVNPTVTAIISPLTHVSGATNTETIVFSDPTMDFILPAINRHSLKIMTADNVEISGNGKLHGEYFDVVESYDIVDPVAAINYLKLNVGSCTNDSVADDSIQSLCKVNLVYRITSGCGCTVYQSIDSIENVNYVYAGLIQCMKIGDYAYVPDAFNNDVQLLSGTTLPIDTPTWNDASKVPYRYYEFSDASFSTGFFIGYDPRIGMANNSNRILNCTDAGMYYSTHKVYPRLINNVTINSGETVEAVCFRCPIIKRNDGSLAVTFNYVGNDIIMCIDYQSAFDGFIDLIDSCVGKQISVIDKTPSCTMNRAIASSTKLPITFSGKGYAVLRFH